MKKFLMSVLVILIVACGMVSCSEEEIDVPDGLQIVKISESEGYQFFGPEGWMIANDGNIAATYVSQINNTSITFTEAVGPTTSITEYFGAQKSSFPYEITVIGNEATTFGNADSAHAFYYTFDYQDLKVACMQIFVENDGSFYIFTYTSDYNGYDAPTDEGSGYQTYLEVVRLAIDSFKFTDKIASESDKKEYPKDDEGYVMVSDKELAGFEFYVPESATVVNSSAVVNVSLSDNANVGLTASTISGISVLDYLRNRKSWLEGIFGDVTDLKIELATMPNLESNPNLFDGFDVGPTANSDLTFGNLDNSQVIAYEYTYVHLGTTYHVYQLLGVDPGVLGVFGAAGYVFTYTATEEEYANHLDTVTNILKKVNFE